MFQFLGQGTRRCRGRGFGNFRSGVLSLDQRNGHLLGGSLFRSRAGDETLEFVHTPYSEASSGVHGLGSYTQEPEKAWPEEGIFIQVLERSMLWEQKGMPFAIVKTPLSRFSVPFMDVRGVAEVRTKKILTMIVQRPERSLVPQSLGSGLSVGGQGNEAVRVQGNGIIVLTPPNKTNTKRRYPRPVGF